MGTEAQRDSHMYFQLGTQYYLAGRFAAFAACFPVAGTLLHHTLEMFLKGDLISHLSRDQLRKISHNLDHLWSRYKQSKPSIGLSRFDVVVAELHRFEDIRYPDLVTDLGMYGTLAIARWTPGPSMRSADGYTPPGYHLVVSDADELVRAIFTASSVNPEVYFDGILSDWRSFLHKDNASFPGA